MSNIIFDFDGTIADTFDLVADVTYQLTGAKRLPEDKIDELRQLPILLGIRRLGGSVWHIPKQLVRTRSMMKQRIGEVPLFDGVAETIKTLHVRGHHLLIMSSNSAANVSAFLQAYHLDEYFEGIYTVPYGNSWFKAHALKKISIKLHLETAKSYYVGNEPLDVRAAHEAGLKSVAVTWSGQSADKLSVEEPDFLIAKPAEILKIFAE